MSGAEIQANAVSTALRGFPLQQRPGWVDVALIVLLGDARAAREPAAAAAAGRSLVALAAAAVYVVATQLAFEHGRGALVRLSASARSSSSSVGSLAAHYLLAAFERERVRDVFSRFVPEAVVEQVLARTDDDLRLGGVALRRDVHVHRPPRLHDLLRDAARRPR